ncbi:hypothetical protein P153DRAFT_368483 [Dothidotthia symphoricarpi CBS 119687]|uniref:Uncharacterized protein n=1 Tax=Dothidotthia symphoricarpi CBS 119687 TaxID=1392245 RepID=A0A6A6A8J8_9PLEO|nr:uncharacterized protein P153DRAFT_368483 [Dothidotthia symphoricarpi CBS 119687]KAF2127147.1 hypothetical protein P153DRAFT_368483 [Dothidotthia symphoricarpi CBS 119687]
MNALIEMSHRSDDLDRITQASQLNSPLLRLPAELRNKIYEYIFYDTRVSFARQVFFLPPRPYYPSHTILLACRQIWHESLPTFHRNIVLQFHCLRDLEDILTDKKYLATYTAVRTIILDVSIAAKLYLRTIPGKGEFIGTLPSLKHVRITKGRNSLPDLRAALFSTIRFHFGRRDIEVVFED